MKRWLVNICRFLLSAVFIFSGFVKAVDPLGTQYKLQDYAEALGMASLLPDWLTLGTAVVLAAVEFVLGILLLFAIQRRITSRVVLAFMAVMTLITLWVALWNPVEDCGCFGDAVKLTNGQTLAKNIVLLACAVVVARWPLMMPRLISKTNQWIDIMDINGKNAVYYFGRQDKTNTFIYGTNNRYYGSVKYNDVLRINAAATVSLANTTLYHNIDSLDATNAFGAVKLTGGSKMTVMHGSAKADTLTAGTGGAELFGGKGNDKGL